MKRLFYWFDLIWFDLIRPDLTQFGPILSDLINSTIIDSQDQYPEALVGCRM